MEASEKLCNSRLSGARAISDEGGLSYRKKRDVSRRTGWVGRNGYAKVMSESDDSPVQRTGVILWRSCGKGRFVPFCGVDSVSVRCELVEITVGGFRTEGAGEAGGGGAQS